MATTLEELAKELGGKVYKDRVEYQVKGNGTKSTRYAYLGETPDLTPHKREGGYGSGVKASDRTPLTTAPDLGFLKGFMTPEAQANFGSVQDSVNRSFSSGNPLDVSELQRYAGANIKPPAYSDTPDYYGEITSGNAGLGITSPATGGSATGGNAGTPAPAVSPEQQRMELLNKQIEALQGNKAPDYAQEYAKAEREAGILKQQQKESDLTAQLNAINAKATADQLRLRQIAGTEGVTEPVYGAQQTRIAQDAAIAALPVQAELAAVQGKLEFAQARLKTMFDLKMKSAEMDYERKNKMIDLIFNYANEEQKIALDNKRREEDRNFTTQRETISYVRDLSAQAMKDGNYKLATELGKLMSNPNTTDEDISRVMGSYSEQGDATSEEAANWAKLISNGQAKLSDVPANLKTAVAAEMAGTNAGSNSLAQSRGADKIEQIVGLIDDKTGVNASSGSFRGFSLMNANQVRDWRANVVNVLSRLTVDELGRVKADGVTFGALSDPERKAVGDSASALNAAMLMDDEGNPTGAFRASEDFVRKNLATIQKYAELDFENRTGQSYKEFKETNILSQEDLDAINEALGVSATTATFNPSNYY